MCECCNRSREYPAYTLFCPSCLHCGARLIQRIGQLPISREDVVRRRRAVLADWMAHGHPEAALRELAAMNAPAIGPVQTTASGGQTPKKLR